MDPHTISPFENINTIVSDIALSSIYLNIVFALTNVGKRFTEYHYRSSTKHKFVLTATETGMIWSVNINNKPGPHFRVIWLTEKIPSYACLLYRYITCIFFIIVSTCYMPYGFLLSTILVFEKHVLDYLICSCINGRCMKNIKRLVASMHGLIKKLTFYCRMA